jgi:hypothetical protein
VSTMTEPTTDDKIQLLVRSVLEAVDTRLDAVRHEIATFSSDVEQRHHHLLESMAALDARITELAGAASSPDGTALAQLTADVDVLRRRVDSVAPATTSPAPPAGPSPESAAPLEVTVAGTAPTLPASAVVTGTHQITREELDEISRPIVTHITTQIPVVPDPTGPHEPLEHMPLRVPPMVAPHFGTASPAPASATDTLPGSASPGDATTTEPATADDEIDLDQLASLLNARLGSLSLPTRPD